MSNVSMFILVFCLIFVNGELIVSDEATNAYSSDVRTILDRLNSQPVKVYNYKDASLLNAHKRGDVTEITIEINVECTNNYPNLPCTENQLICNAFVGRGIEILGDVICKPKITSETFPTEFYEDTTSYDLNTETSTFPDSTQSVLLSHEAASSESGEPFMAIHRDTIPCLGCPIELNKNIDGVQELVEIGLKHIESEKTRKYNVNNVLNVYRQIVNGVKYILIVEVAPTLCDKQEIYIDQCLLDTQLEWPICRIVYLQKPWISKTKHIISNNCTNSQEFTLEMELSNEIDTNYEKLNDKQRLADIESQILVATDLPKSVSSSVNYEMQAIEDRPRYFNTEPVNTEYWTSNFDDFTTEFNDEERQRRSSTSGNVERENSLSSSEETKNVSSSEEKQKKVENVSSSSSEEKQNKTEKASGEEANVSSSEEGNGRQRRSVGHLEKISSNEKALVRDLADFAAATLDNIDDDNQKRIVLQILGAKKMQQENGVTYQMVLRLGITQCLEDKPINDECRKKFLPNFTKNCRIQVHLNGTNAKLLKSTCQNTKRDDNSDVNRTNYSRYKRQLIGGESSFGKTYPRIKKFETLQTGRRRRRRSEQHLLGGERKQSINDPKIDNYLKDGLNYINSQSGNNYKYKLGEVLSATKQVVAGHLWRIKARIVSADCTENDVNCNVKICDFKIHDQPWLPNGRQTNITCDNNELHSFRSKRHIKEPLVGGEREEAKDNPNIQKYLTTALEYLDSKSTETNKYIVEEIVSATHQTVAGSLWRIKAKIALSDCGKNSTMDRSKCGILSGTQGRICDFKVHDRPWLANGRETNITCDNEELHSFRNKREDSLEAVGLFEKFIKDYNKVYDSDAELGFRFDIFRKNLARIEEFKQNELGTATYGITKFADLSEMEFSLSHGLRRVPFDSDNNDVSYVLDRTPDIPLPVKFDWRKKGVVSKVKDQGQCGSCWAFSVTGNVEGQYALKHGKLLEFSEQELVDCDKTDEGCNGGLMDTAYRAIEEMGGLESEQDYPYDARNEKCHFNKSLIRVELSGSVNISTNETDMMKWLVKNGPISIAINANAMQFYMGGVSHPLKFLCSPKDLDHGVLIVGYGVDKWPLFHKKLPYWIVKNSWGRSWGEQGYYRVFRGDGTCGLNQTPSSAIVG